MAAGRGTRDDRASPCRVAARGLSAKSPRHADARVGSLRGNKVIRITAGASFNLARERHDNEQSVLMWHDALRLVQLVSGRTSGAKAAVGSPFYMSPEQMQSASDVDHRTDIWALGVILFEPLTTAVPFEGESRRIRDLLHGVTHRALRAAGRHRRSWFVGQPHPISYRGDPFRLARAVGRDDCLPRVASGRRGSVRYSPSGIGSNRCRPDATSDTADSCS